MRANSAWFSHFRNQPDVNPITGETRSELVKRLLVEIEQNRQRREIEKENDRILKFSKSRNRSKKISDSQYAEGKELGAQIMSKSIAQQEERMARVQIEVRQGKKSAKLTASVAHSKTTRQ